MTSAERILNMGVLNGVRCACSCSRQTFWPCSMRFCSKDGSLDLKHKGKATAAPSGMKPWFEWNLKILQDPIHLLFGHWAALEGVTGKKNITGLDTGCVWGKKLSALRLEDNRIFSCNKIN